MDLSFSSFITFINWTIGLCKKKYNHATYGYESHVVQAIKGFKCQQ